MRHHRLNAARLGEAQALRYEHLGFELCGRTASNLNVPAKVALAPSRVPFSDVACNGDRCPPGLSHQSETLVARQIPCNAIDLVNKIH